MLEVQDFCTCLLNLRFIAREGHRVVCMEWDDLYQDLACHVWGRRAKYDETRSSAVTWASKVAVNRVRDLRSKVLAKKAAPPFEFFLPIYDMDIRDARPDPECAAMVSEYYRMVAA